MQYYALAFRALLKQSLIASTKVEPSVPLSSSGKAPKLSASVHFLGPSSDSAHDESAIDGYGLTGDVAGTVATEPKNRVGNLLRFAVSRHWNNCEQGF